MENFRKGIFRFNGGVAQLGEHLLCKQGVIGSNPFISTNFPGCFVSTLFLEKFRIKMGS